MIYLDRSKSNAAGRFASELEGHKNDALNFFSMPESKRGQSRFDFVDVDQLWDLKMALIEEFHGKCAYTEARIDPKSCRIIRHRPRNGAANLEGSSDRDHYWWLAYEWENLIPVLPECARAKSHYFPVEGPRATSKMSLEKVRDSESPLLPDPSLPSPASKLIFEQSGRVEILSRNPQHQSALDILGLNTSQLIEKRLRLLKTLSAEEKKFSKSRPDKLLARFFTKRSEFLELKFQWLERLLIGSNKSFKDQWRDTLEKLNDEFPLHRIQTLLSSISKTSRAVDPSDEISRDRKPKAGVFGSTSPGKKRARKKGPPPTPTTFHTIQIQKIEIVNFKCIDKLTLNLPQSGDHESPNGLMILGENGSGKSSVLQAVALALEDPEDLVNHPFLTHKKVLRRGEHKGYVRLHLLDQSEPVEVSFSRTKFTFSGPRSQLSFFLSAYGPHRIMPRYNDESPELKVSDPIAINNLWDPYESLVDAERWMLALDNKTFDAFALALKDLLDLRNDGLVYRKNKKLYFDIGGEMQSLDDLSAGYKSIIATATDIIASYPIKGIDMHQATGIVMIDEIGAHLHPRWRMRIVEAYRRTFTGIQFLCTTHEPLCLRGTRKEEVVVLAQGDGAVNRIIDVPNLEEMRIDQILTSPIFGMQTTVDPEAERKFQEYYYLLAKKKRTKEEIKKTEELKNYLYRYGVLGTDRRSRAIYDLIDKDLATQEVNARDTGVSAETRKKFHDLWDNTEFDF